MLPLESLFLPLSHTTSHWLLHPYMLIMYFWIPTNEDVSHKTPTNTLSNSFNSLGMNLLVHLQTKSSLTSTILARNLSGLSNQIRTLITVRHLFVMQFFIAFLALSLSTTLMQLMLFPMQFTRSEDLNLLEERMHSLTHMDFSRMLVH